MDFRWLECPVIIPYLGGKFELSRKLVPMIPYHERYIEVFAGGASMFFRKVKTDFSVLNDKDNDIVNLYMKEAYSKGGSIINLNTGGGKTVIALNIISLIKKKTIILIHKSFLLDQRYQRIIEFLPGIKVSKIQGTTFNTDGDIILVMIQTLINRDIPDSLINEVGFLCADECHHLSAEKFSKSLVKINPKYLLGLSATVKRGDNLQ